MDASTALGVAGTVILALGSVAWWFMRHTNSRVDDERRARELAIENERKGREEDRHTLRDEITTVSSKLQAHELHVAREYVNHDRLAMALKPLEDSVGRVEGTLSRLFDELKGKVDKP